MSAPTMREARRVMESLVQDARDATTGEVNYTGLAEATAQALDWYVGEEAAIPDELFDLAVEFQ